MGPHNPVNIIIATDGSVTLGVVYHSWIVATEEEDIILQDGGPDDGDLFLMQSYWSELGGRGSRTRSPWNTQPVGTH
jgi:hypothetical protein